MRIIRKFVYLLRVAVAAYLQEVPFLLIECTFFSFSIAAEACLFLTIATLRNWTHSAPEKEWFSGHLAEQQLPFVLLIWTKIKRKEGKHVSRKLQLIIS